MNEDVLMPYQSILLLAKAIAIQVNAGGKLTPKQEQFCRINRGQEPVDDLGLICRFALYRSTAIYWRCAPHRNIREAKAWESEAKKCYEKLLPENKW